MIKNLNELNKKYLDEEYTNKQRLVSDIAKEFGITTSCIYYRIKKYRIKQINHSGKINKDTIFGKLKTVKITSVSKWGQNIWECHCSCGNISHVTTTALKNGRSTSCGCNQRKRGEKSHRWNGIGCIGKWTWTRIKNNAKVRNIEFKIKIEESFKILQSQNFKCYLSGLEIYINGEKNKTASLDRINNDLGYIDENVAWCHKDINNMKYCTEICQFINYCNLVANFKSNFVYKKYNSTIYPNYFNKLKHSAGKRKKTFEITINDIIQKYEDQGFCCAMTGLELFFPSNSKEYNYHRGKIMPFTASVDRIDNNIGYIKSNIQITHKEVNMSRKNLTIEYYKELCTLVSEYNQTQLLKGRLKTLKCI